VSPQIRRLAAVLMGAYALLFIQLNVVQIFRADNYRVNPANTRDFVRSFTEPRGSIRTADSEVIAETLVTEDDLERLRVYPHGELYSHVIGFLSLEFGATGLEQQYNSQLAGQDVEIRLQSLSDLFVDRDRTGQLELTIRHDLQLVARAALGERNGSVVALDPTTGAVLAMWSRPAYDPNLLSSHDISAVRTERFRLLEDPQNPLLARSYRERFPPGSTFKIVTAAAGLDSGLVTQDAPIYPVTDEYIAPQTERAIQNFGGSSCGGTLGELLRVSCNTGFAEMAIQIGPQAMVEEAEAFGFNTPTPIDLPDPAASIMPSADFFADNLPLLAQSGIGQFEVAATPLQMAMIASTIANRGILMRPYVVERIVDADGNVIDDPDTKVLGQPIGFTTAAQLQNLMLRVVDEGTASSLRINGVLVGAKTGTAELPGRKATHAWIIAFAPADNPLVAVAVLVEADDALGQQTGGTVAGPIARAMIEAILELPPSLESGQPGTESVQN
jgi:penicillin-binding protein A